MPAGHIRDWLISDPMKSDPVEKSENCIEDKKDQRGADNEGGPRSGHAAMAKVGPKIEAETLGNDSAAAKPDDTGSRCPFAMAVETSFSSLSQSPLPGQGAIDHLGYPLAIMS